MPFIPTEMQKATNTFSKLSGAFIMVEAWLIPIYSSATGTPLEKIIIARLIPMPNIPQTTARGAIPKPGFRYTPELRRSPSSSPRVESIANLRKLMTIPCSALNVLYQSYSDSFTKNGANSRMTSTKNRKSDFFMM